VNDDERSALFARARGAGTPTDADRRRVRSALTRKMGMAAGAVVTTSTTKAAGLAGATSMVGMGGSTMLAVKVGAVALAVVAATAGAVVLHGQRTTARSAPLPVASSAEARGVAPLVSATPLLSPHPPSSLLPSPSPPPSPLPAAPSAASGAWATATSRLAATPTGPLPASRAGSMASPSLEQGAVADPLPTAPIAIANELPGVNVRPGPSASATASSTASPARVPDGTAEELALIQQMQEALRAGDAARTLAFVHEHERRFPAGQLTPECDGAKVLALCMGASRDRAAALGRAYLDSHARSPLAARVRATCGLDGANDSDTDKGRAGQ
jgi:hypothetical protein